VPLDDPRRNEIELFDGRRWGVNSKGEKFFWCQTGTKKPFHVFSKNMKPGTLVVPLPPQYVAYELPNGWLRFYKKEKEKNHAVHSTSR
jgi:hypothetical protein